MVVASSIMVIFPDSYAPSQFLVITSLGLTVLYVWFIAWLTKCLMYDKVIPDWKIFLLFGMLLAIPFFVAIVLLVIFLQ